MKYFPPKEISPFPCFSDRIREIYLKRYLLLADENSFIDLEISRGTENDETPVRISAKFFLVRRVRGLIAG